MARCGECRFYVQDKRSGFGRSGFCHIRSGPIDSFPRREQDDWCGEHESVKPTAAASIETLAPLLERFLAVADAMQTRPDILVVLDLTDEDGDALDLHSLDFTNLAAGWAAVRGA